MGTIVVGGRKIRTGIVYFMLAEEINRVKIGFTDDLEKRARGLNTTSPVALKLLTSIESDSFFEAFLHKKFDHLRIRGEWFNFTSEIDEYIFSEKIKDDCNSNERFTGILKTQEKRRTATRERIQNEKEEQEQVKLKIEEMRIVRQEKEARKERAIAEREDQVRQKEVNDRKKNMTLKNSLVKRSGKRAKVLNSEEREFLKKVGEKIKSKRAYRGISAQSAANEIGIAIKNQFSRESGNVDLTITDLSRYAAIFNCTIADLLP